jgi:hypothetical protein
LSSWTSALLFGLSLENRQPRPCSIRQTADKRRKSSRHSEHLSNLSATETI